MRIEPIRAPQYPMPVQGVGGVGPVKRSNVINSYLQTVDTTTEAANENRRKFDRLENAEEKPDFRAIDLIKKSEIPPPEPPKIEERLEAAETFSQNINEIEGLPAETSVQKRTEIQNEEVNESATLQSSDEIEEKAAGNKLTPAQQKGVEAYQRVQNYINPLSLSNARMVS